MALSGSEVQPSSDGIAIGLGDQGHRSFLGNVLTDQAIEVFIATAFP